MTINRGRNRGEQQAICLTDTFVWDLLSRGSSDSTPPTKPLFAAIIDPSHTFAENNFHAGWEWTISRNGLKCRRRKGGKLWPLWPFIRTGPANRGRHWGGWSAIIRNIISEFVQHWRHGEWGTSRAQHLSGQAHCRKSPWCFQENLQSKQNQPWQKRQPWH